MIMLKPGRILAAGLLCAGFVAGPASAATVEFINWECTECLVDPTVSINNGTANFFDVDIGLFDGAGLLTAFYADVGSPTGVEAGDITLIADASANTISILDFKNGGNVGTVGNTLAGGENLNGLTNDGFDFGFSFENGTSPAGALPPVSFLISMAAFGGFDLGDFSRIGLRFRTVVCDPVSPCEGSDKLLSSTIIPLPAALPMFLLALGGLGLVGRRRRQAAA